MVKYVLNIEKKVHEIVKSESIKRRESMKSLVQNAIIEYFNRHKVVTIGLITSESQTKDIEVGVLYDFLDEYIKKHTYFNLRSLSIGFLMNSESLIHKDASKSEDLGKIIYRFSKITKDAIQQKILMKFNSRTFKVIQKPIRSNNSPEELQIFNKL